MREEPRHDGDGEPHDHDQDGSHDPGRPRSHHRDPAGTTRHRKLSLRPAFHLAPASTPARRRLVGGQASVSYATISDERLWPGSAGRRGHRAPFLLPEVEALGVPRAD